MPHGGPSGPAPGPVGTVDTLRVGSGAAKCQGVFGFGVSSGTLAVGSSPGTPPTAFGAVGLVLWTGRPALSQSYGADGGASWESATRLDGNEIDWPMTPPVVMSVGISCPYSGPPA